MLRGMRSGWVRLLMGKSVSCSLRALIICAVGEVSIRVPLNEEVQHGTYRPCSATQDAIQSTEASD